MCGCTNGPPCSAGGKTFKCPQGDTMLRGKDMTLLIAIWDSGDGILDSSALVDNFKWSVDGATGVTTNPTPPN